MNTITKFKIAKFSTILITLVGSFYGISKEMNISNHKFQSIGDAEYYYRLDTKMSAREYSISRPILYFIYNKDKSSLDDIFISTYYQQSAVKSSETLDKVTKSNKSILNTFLKKESFIDFYNHIQFSNKANNNEIAIFTYFLYSELKLMSREQAIDLAQNSKEIIIHSNEKSKIDITFKIKDSTHSFNVSSSELLTILIIATYY